MKIVCGSCSAKYSISDDKVKGKVFKIRCKKCSNVIVVKGGVSEDAAPEAGASEWFVVIDGEQVGPINKDELEGYFLGGRINGVTYTWRDGMADWIPLSDVPEFSHLEPVRASPEAATNVVDASHYRANLTDNDATISETASSLGLSASADPFGADPVFGGSAQDPFGAPDPFASSSDALGANDLFNTAGASDPYASDPYGASDPYASSNDSDPYASNDAFASQGEGYNSAQDPYAAPEPYSEPAGFQAAPADPYASESYDDPFSNGQGAAIDSMGSGGLFGAFDEDAPAQQQPQISSSMGASNDMVGVRNENSVLFSLSSLDQVKAVNPSASVNTMDTTNGIGEGSGLIDIQALAAAHSSLSGSGGTPGSGASGLDGSPSRGVDPFAHGTMAMPALMPMGSHKSNTTLYIIIGVVSFLLLAAIGVAAYVFTRPEPLPEVVTKEVIKEAPAGVTKEELMKLLAEAKKSGDNESTLKAKEKIAALEKKEIKPPKKESAREKKKRLKAEKKERERKALAQKNKPKKDTKKSSGIDDLLSGIGGKKPKKDTTPAKKEESKGVKPAGAASLTRSQVKGTIRRYGGRVANCAKTSNKAGKKGTVKVGFYIKPSGRVTGAKVKGSFAGSDVGRCVQKVVAGMKFPKTAATKNQKITYPFSIR